MPRSLLFAWCWALIAVANGETPADLDACNVVEQTPALDASGAMPLGNGELGASVWVEPNGDLVLYLARSDSFSEACRLLKIGKLRVAFEPRRSTAFGRFHQELTLAQGRLEIELDQLHLEVFVESDRPVVRIGGFAPQPFTTRVTYEGWRRERRALNGTAELGNSGWTMQNGPPSVPVVESADVVVASTAAPQALAWYHHNRESVVPFTLRHQSCEGLPGAVDPLLHRIFGAWIEGPGLRREGPETTISAPSRRLDLRIACPTMIAAEVQPWLERAGSLAKQAPAFEPSRRETEARWSAFWNRSWVFVDTSPGPEDPRVLVGEDARGSRFVGEFGRVSVYSRALRGDEVAELATGLPTSAKDDKDRVYSGVRPALGSPLPRRMESRSWPPAGFTLEAWVRPEGASSGTILFNEGPRGFCLDAHDGNPRLACGQTALALPTPAATAKASASHAFNSLAALNDQEPIASSNDRGIERFTWWDHRGGDEWVQYDFSTPTTVDAVEVYWFDDRPTGGACRVPQSWRLLYKDQDRWRPVETGATFDARADRFNRVPFAPVRAAALRIEAKLAPGFSAGILEWRVGEAGAAKLLIPNTWRHVAATRTPEGTMTLYCDGRMVAHARSRRATPLSQAYNLQRYLFACQGRGEAPIKFNGGMYCVEPRYCSPGNELSPDWRLWGDGYWYQNTRHAYHPMLAAGDFDLMGPFFAFYGRALPLARSRARAWYAAEGAFFPETMSFFGSYPNGDYGWDRANRRPGEVLCSAWRHAWNQGPEIVDLMLDYWDYTRDRRFLAVELLPMAEAVLRYFDTRFRKENGKIVLDPTQAVETFRAGVLDDMPTVAGLRSITARLCGLPDDSTTAGQRTFFHQMREACPAVPTEEKSVGGRSERSLAPARTYQLEGWNCENADLYAVWPFRLYGVGKPDLNLALTAFRTRRYSVDNGWGYDGNAAALVGEADAAAANLEGRRRNSHPAYRFPATWGPNYDWLPDQTHGGGLMETLQLMLVQPVGRRLLLLPAWPRRWDVAFRLHAPENTVIEAEVRNGKVVRLEVQPPERRRDVELPSGAGAITLLENQPSPGDQR